MNEIRLSKDTVLRLGPGVVWEETQPGRAIVRRGRGSLAAAGRRALACFGGLVFIGALSGAAFVLGTSVGAGLDGNVLADAAIPGPPPIAGLAPTAPRAEPPQRASAAAAAPRAADSDDPFGLRR